ncbi:MAG TPA: hypothetical protein VN577_10065 [Terriglobales bacterium]|nr:hypothetical protein [Terriglobales bacterium]
MLGYGQNQFGLAPYGDPSLIPFDQRGGVSMTEILSGTVSSTREITAAAGVRQSTSGSAGTKEGMSTTSVRTTGSLD